MLTIEIYAKFKGMPNTRLTNAKWKRILEFLRSDSSVYVKDEAECSKFIELADKGYDSDGVPGVCRSEWSNGCNTA